MSQEENTMNSVYLTCTVVGRTITILAVVAMIILGTTGDHAWANSRSEECQELPGEGTFRDPYRMGTLRGPGHWFIDCMGFPANLSRTDHFEFRTRRRAQRGNQILIMYELKSGADRNVSLALEDADNGAILYSSFQEPIDCRRNICERTIDLYRLPPSSFFEGGPLPAGTWILRTERISLHGGSPNYDILIDAPGR